MKQQPTGKAYNGTIKTLGEVHGFIECNQVKAQYGSDVFIGTANSDGIQVGATVNFELMVNQDHRPQAIKLAQVNPEPLGGASFGCMEAGVEPWSEWGPPTKRMRPTQAPWGKGWSGW